MLALVDRHPEVDVISGLRYFIPSTNPGLVERYYTTPRGVIGVARNQFGLIRITTPTAAIKRSTYERAGGFAPEFKIGEDTYLTLKLIETGASILIADHWLLGHKSGQTLMGEVRRYYHYGFSDPLYLLLSQDWRMDPTHYVGTSGGAFRALYQWYRRIWKVEEMQELALTSKIPLLVVGLIIGCAMQVGIARGLRHFRKIHKTGLPTVPPLEEQMSGFIFGAAVDHGDQRSQSVQVLR